MSTVDISGYIVPWSLPNEEMPMHVTWGPDVFVDEIQVKVPSDIAIDDVWNVDEVILREHEAIITKLKTPLEGVPSYFGMIVSAPEIFQELKAARKIEVKFIREGKCFYYLDLYCRIFRPCLEMKCPSEIELADSVEKNKLPISLKYVGFGDIELKIEATIGGQIVSVGESIVYELLRRLWLLDVDKKKRHEKVVNQQQRKHKDLQLEPTYVRRMAQELQEKIDGGVIPAEEIDSEAILELREWLNDARTKDRFMEVLYEKTEELLLDLLVDLFKKNPTDNVKLANTETVIRTRIKAPVTTLTLKLSYIDKMQNKYPPIEKKIQVKDKRSESGELMIEIPIDIEKWEDEPFLNVEKMSILEENNVGR